MKRREWLKALIAAPLAAVVPPPEAKPSRWTFPLPDSTNVNIRMDGVINESQFSDAVLRALRNAEKMGRFNAQKMGRFIP
jgi:hypothetical protein